MAPKVLIFILVYNIAIGKATGNSPLEAILDDFLDKDWNTCTFHFFHSNENSLDWDIFWSNPRSLWNASVYDGLMDLPMLQIHLLVDTMYIGVNTFQIYPQEGTFHFAKFLKNGMLESTGS